MSQIDDDTRVLAKLITVYLKQHPEAADTVEGIAMWWIPQNSYPQIVQKVSETLKYMVENKLISRMTLSDGRKIYSTKKI